MNETPAQMSPVFDVVEPIVARRLHSCVTMAMPHVQ